MGLSMKETINLGRSMDKGCLIGVTNQLSKGNSITIIFMVLVFMYGVTAGSMRANGNQIRWMGLEYLLGQMAGDILAIMWMIKSRGMGNSYGLIRGNTKEGGLMGSNTEKAFIHQTRV